MVAGVGREVRSILVHEYVTGGGLAGQDLPASWAAEGGAMRRALALDFATLPGVRVTCTLDDRLPDEPGPWMLARIGAGQEPDRLAALATGADAVLVIAPETDGLLQQRAAWLQDWRVRSLGSQPEAIALTGDKFRFGQHLAALGIATPEGRLWEPDAPAPAVDRFPVIVKPRDGAGTLDTFVVADARDLANWPESHQPRLVQPEMPGVPLSASFLVGNQGQTVLVGVARQWIERSGNQLHYRGGAMPYPTAVPMAALHATLASVPGLRGWVGIDFLWDPASGALTVLELNPRPTTSYVGWRHLQPAGELARNWLAGLGLREPAGAWPTSSLTPPTRGRAVAIEPDGRLTPGDPTDLEWHKR